MLKSPKSSERLSPKSSPKSSSSPGLVPPPPPSRDGGPKKRLLHKALEEYSSSEDSDANMKASKTDSSDLDSSLLDTSKLDMTADSISLDDSFYGEKLPKEPFDEELAEKLYREIEKLLNTWSQLAEVRSGILAFITISWNNIV